MIGPACLPLQEKKVAATPILRNRHAGSAPHIGVRTFIVLYTTTSSVPIPRFRTLDS